MDNRSTENGKTTDGVDRRAPDSPMRADTQQLAHACNSGARVIFVNRYFYPDQAATSQLLSELAFDLAQHCSVSVICSQSTYHGCGANYPRRQTHQRVNILRVRGHWGKRITGLLGRVIEFITFLTAATWTVWRTVRPGDLVVAKTDPPLLGVAVGLAAHLRGARTVNWLQDVYPEIAVQLQVVSRHNPLIPIMKWLRDYSVRKAACNVVISEGMRKYIHQRVPQAELIIRENWATGRIHTLPAQQSALRMRHFGENSLVLGYSGNLGRPHPPALLLAAGNALKLRQEIKFLMIGGGLNMQYLREQTTAMGLANWRFLPFQPIEQLSDSLAAADVHVVLQDARLEGLLFPSKLIGVLAAGRPCVFIGDVAGEAANLIEDHACGIAVDGNDLPGLLLAIERLQDPTLRTMMGRRARRLYDTRFASQTIKAHWRQTLLELVGASERNVDPAQLGTLIEEKRAV